MSFWHTVAKSTFFASPCTKKLMISWQGVALTGRNRTVPPCGVGRRTGHAPGPAAADHPRALQTTTDDRVQNITGPLGGPVITAMLTIAIIMTCTDYILYRTEHTHTHRRNVYCRQRKFKKIRNLNARFDLRFAHHWQVELGRCQRVCLRHHILEPALTSDLQNLIRSSAAASEYAPSLLSKLFKPFLRCSGNNIWTDEWDSLKHNTFADTVGWLRHKGRRYE